MAVTVNPGGADTEQATVKSVGIGTLVMSANLANNHAAGEPVRSESYFLLAGPALSCYELKLDNSSVLGETDTVLLDLASNAIFTGNVLTRRVQSGCVRFSYFPSGSRVPRPYACPPSYPQGATAAQRAALALAVRPCFTSTTYGDPGYSQLSQNCPPEVFQGADNGAEMGVFNFLLAAPRIQSLNAALAEYLRFGLEAGVSLAT
jgi:hypothetical protein